MWVKQNLPVFPIIISHLWLENRSRNPCGACTLVWCLIRVTSYFLGTLKLTASAFGLRTQEDWDTGATLSSRSLSQMFPLWTEPQWIHLCWSLYTIAVESRPLLTARHYFDWPALSPGNSLIPESAASENGAVKAAGKGSPFLSPLSLCGFQWKLDELP